VLFPFFHLLDGLDSLRFELWPLLFYRDEPNLLALRLWPLHADESKVSAGDFWVSKYLFLSKRFVKEDAWSYRLDPFIFRISGGPDESSIGGLFELMAYSRKGQESSFRILPLAFGSAGEKGSNLGIVPLYYQRDFGPEEIDYLLPWRFTSIFHHLEGQSGERHTGVLWKLFQYTDNPNRPEYHEISLLHRFLFHRRTETSREFQFNLLFSYYRNDVDDETQYSYFFYIYSWKSVRGQATHKLFGFLEF
jgi:hypothetical protein